MAEIIEKSPAKVNLFLHVLGKREDGYHNLQSLIAFTEFGDELIAEPANNFSLRAAGEFSANVESFDNIIVKTYKIFHEIATSHNKKPQEFKFTINKNVPISAGLGGGSGNAAAVMRLLIKQWELKFSEGQIEKIALAIGADVPACFYSSPVFIKNIGEIDKKLESFPGYPVVLLNPKIPMPTEQVFKKFSGTALREMETKTTYDLDEAMRLISSERNDLQATSQGINITIADAISSLNKEKGKVLARMTGSGATCFAIFESKRTAEDAAKNIAAKNKNWWVKATTLIGV